MSKESIIIGLGFVNLTSFFLSFFPFKVLGRLIAPVFPFSFFAFFFLSCSKGIGTRVFYISYCE